MGLCLANLQVQACNLTKNDFFAAGDFNGFC